MQFGRRTHHDPKKKTDDAATSTQPRAQSSQRLVSHQAQNPSAPARTVQHAARQLSSGSHGKDASQKKKEPNKAPFSWVFHGSFVLARYDQAHDGSSHRRRTKRALRFDTRLLQLLQKKSTAPQACTRSSSAAHCGQWATRVNWWPQAVQGLSP